MKLILFGFWLFLLEMADKLADFAFGKDSPDDEQIAWDMF